MDYRYEFQSWYKPLEWYLRGLSMHELKKFLNERSKKSIIYPKREDAFRIFKEVPYDKVKIVIVGQDPYHNGLATGLAFANPENTVKLSPSLSNIKKELEEDLDKLIVGFDPTLESWSNQGVFLYNTALTVERGKPGSHSKQWVEFSAAVFKALSKKKDLIYILWGNHAQKYLEHGVIGNGYIIKSPHPSPLSADKGFFGSKPFSRANKLLKELNKKEIKWIRT